MKNKNKRVVITGVGPLSSLGVGREEFWSGVLGKREDTKKEKVFIDNKLWDEYSLYKLTDFDINNFGLRNEVLEDINQWKNNEKVIDLHYLMASSKLALDDSNLDCNKYSHDTGLILTHENPGIDQFAEKLVLDSYKLIKKDVDISLLDLFKNIFEENKKSAYDLQTFMFLFHVGKALNLHGPSLFLNNACASGLYALEMARLLIISGHCKAVVVAAADHPDIFKYLWFKEIGVYAQNEKIKPFSEDADGFLFGDGGAAIVCESLESAVDRGANIYSEYLGGAFSQEGWKVSFPAVHKKFYINTMLRALEMTGVNSKDIDLVVPHGVAMKVTDLYEADGLNAVFGNLSKKPLFSAFKPFVGHNLGASTLVETIILLLAMKSGVVPPTLNTAPVNTKIEIQFNTDFKEVDVNLAVKSVTAFAGFNAASIFKRYIK